MKFSKTWPDKSGWYWYVDVTYPQPTIGFIQQNILYDSKNREYNRDNSGTQKHIRIGDMIIVPKPADNEIE
jgi:hypothetical protein